MHFRLRNIWAMAGKEGRTMLRDHALLAAILAQPVLYLVLFGLAITNEVNNAPWIVYDQSQTAISRRLVRDLSSMTALQPPIIASSEDAVVDFLRRQDGMVGVVIPWNLDDKLQRSEEAPIQVLINGANPTSALRLTSYISQVASRFSLSELPARDRSEQRVTQPSVSIEKRYWYNPGIQDHFGFLSAMPANMLTQVLFMIAAVALVRERERGTFEQLLATPLSLADRTGWSKSSCCWPTRLLHVSWKRSMRMWTSSSGYIRYRTRSESRNWPNMSSRLDIRSSTGTEL